MASIDDIFRGSHQQSKAPAIFTWRPGRSRCPHRRRAAGDRLRRSRPELNRKLLYELMTPAQVAFFEKNREIDVGYEIPLVTRLRCNIFEQRSQASRPCSA